MRKGLTKTLLTVAVALLGYQAMSMAPTIGNIPDVIIGDAEEGSGSNRFVFQDAIDLDTYVTDDTTSDAGIIWSAINVTGNYAINNKASVTDGNQNAPGAAALTSGADDAESVDSNLRTATFRNKQYSPTPGADGTEPPFSGIGAGEVLTLYASDGTTYSADGKSIMVYIDNGGSDALSSSGPQPTNVLSLDFGAGTNGWVTQQEVVVDGTVSYTQNGTSGLCVNTSALGVNLMGWASETRTTGSPYSSIDLVNNAVYQVRVQTSTNAAAGATPLWSINAQQSVDLFGLAYLFYDNFGGANAPVAAGGRTSFEGWFAVPQVATPRWQAGGFTGAVGSENDFRLYLRIIDAAGAGYGAETDSGQLCWKAIEVNRYDYDTLTPSGAPVFQADTFSQAPGTVTTPDQTVWTVQDFVANSTVTYGNSITITPVGTGWGSSGPGGFLQLYPGDTTRTVDPLTQPDNYMIPWESDTLYRMTAQISAQSATDGPDFFFLGLDAFSNEIIANAYVTAKYGSVGMPNTTAAPYSLFVWSHTVSAAAEPQFRALRPNLQIGANAEFVDISNASGIIIESVTVEKIGL